MPTEEKKGITVQVDAELHAEVKAYSKSHGMTMAEFVSLALQDELHPKFKTKEDMGNMRTLAFQVPEDLFQRIKDYLQRNNITQKEFVIRLIEDEQERDQTERENAEQLPEENEEYAEPGESTAVGDCDTVSEWSEDYAEEQNESALSGDSEDEDENMGFSMGM